MINHLEYNGIKIILNIHLPEPLTQFKFPKSKKRRVRKKFRNNKLNYKHKIRFIHNTITNEIYIGKIGFEMLQKLIK